MKTTIEILDLKQRHESDRRASRQERNFPHTEQHYQSCQLTGNCGEPVKFQEPSFFKISNNYFADEAPRGFAVDAGVFSALMLAVLLPIVNSLQAVATLIHYVGVL